MDVRVAGSERSMTGGRKLERGTGRRRALALPALAALAVASSACGDRCNRGDDSPATPYEDGRSPAPGTYETSSVEGPYLDFSSGRRWELLHRLGVVPVPDAFVSFQRCPTETPCEEGDEQTGGFARAAGNVVVFEELNERAVVLRNDTCADFFLRVVLRAP